MSWGCLGFNSEFLCMPMFQNAKNKEENVQEMEDWAVKPWSCKRKQAGRWLHLPFDFLCGMSPGTLRFQETDLYCCWPISDIKSGTIFIFILIHTFFVLKSHQIHQLIQLSFQNMVMRQQDSNHTDCHHLPWEASDMINILLLLLCISLIKKEDMFYDQA